MDTTENKPATNADASPFEEEPSSGPRPVKGAGELVAVLVTSPHASATIASKKAAVSREVPGVADVILAEDLGDLNRQQPMRPDEPLLAESEVHFRGQPVAMIVAESEEAAAEAARELKIDFHPAQPILDVEHAVAMNSFHGESRAVRRGRVDEAIGDSAFSLEGSIDVGSQLPYSREPLWARVVPEAEPGIIEVWTTSELPDRVRQAVSETVNVSESRIWMKAGKLSGCPGGRQAESAMVAILCALASDRTGAAVTLRLDRSTDTILSAKRHALRAEFRAGFENDGRINGVGIRFLLDAGYAIGDSDSAMDSLLLHADGAYFVENFDAEAQLCRTHRVTGAAISSEGIAQGAIVMEEIVTRVADRVGLSPDHVRTVNLYREAENRHSTHYGQPVTGDDLDRIWRETLRVAQIDHRRKQIRAWNEGNPCFKRGIGAVPLKAGIGDPRADRNQANVLVHLHVDGSASVSLGCVDNGSGLPDRIAEETARQFGIDPAGVTVRCGDLNCTPEMTAQVGVDYAGLMRRAIGNACFKLVERLRPVAAQLLAAAGVEDADPDTIRFGNGNVGAGAQIGITVPFSAVVKTAWRRRVNLSSVGFFRTPNLWWDREVGAGWPFAGFVFGSAVVEVQLDAFTGEVQILQADIVHPGGPPHHAELDRAQISRALSLGFGWMLNESVAWSDNGALISATADHYAIPGYGDAPLKLNIDLVPSTGHPAEDVAASGAEGAVVLAVAAREAVRDAIRSFGPDSEREIEINLAVPATPENVLCSLREMSRNLAEARRKSESQRQAIPPAAGNQTSGGQEAGSQAGQPPSSPS